MVYSFKINKIKDFNLRHTFECGQCFRWLKNQDDSYTGVVGNSVFNVRLLDDGSLYVESSLPDSEEFFNGYIDNQTDYSLIKKHLAQKDESMKAAVEFGYGIRILRQDHWETLVSFIISANNFIPRIMKSVKKISEAYGQKIEFKGQTYYTFPDASRLVDIEEDDLKLCGLGFRCKYIKQAARMVASGEIDLKAIEQMNSSQARDELIKISGVGPKISDCVMLYSYAKPDVFPTDVWIKRVVETLYFGEEKKLREIQEFAREKFGNLAGFAQQYLFYYARENKIGTRP